MKNKLLRIALPCALILFTTCEKLEIKLATKISTVSISPSITAITATGNIIDLSASLHSEYGFCYSTTENPTVNDAIISLGTATIGEYSATIEGLTVGQTYYIRAYCKDGDVYVYGETKTATTLTTVSDVDGNIYNIVIIGTQIWMKENLKTTKYRDGTAIPNIIGSTAWTNQTTGAYCWYNDDATTNKATYGALYNWYAVVDSRNLCPTGWHVPTDTEWSTLTTYLGGESIAGGKMKAITLWDSPNTGADNSSGFTALPGGARTTTIWFYYLGNGAFWWSSMEFDAKNARYLGLRTDYATTFRSYQYKSWGLSVRCVMD